MTPLLAVVLAVVALLLPAAPFALDYADEAIHDRRHAACLRRIAALELELGMREPDALLTWAEHLHAPAPPGPTMTPSAFEKAWAKNRKRLAAIPRERGKGRR